MGGRRGLERPASPSRAFAEPPAAENPSPPGEAAAGAVPCRAGRWAARRPELRARQKGAGAVSPGRDVDPGPHHRWLADAHHRGRLSQSHHRGAARAGVGAVRRAARVPAPLLPGQAGEAPRGRGWVAGRAAGGAPGARGAEPGMRGAGLRLRGPQLQVLPAGLEAPGAGPRALAVVVWRGPAATMLSFPRWGGSELGRAAGAGQPRQGQEERASERANEQAAWHHPQR